MTGRQIALFPVPRPGRSRRRDPATSKAAARSVEADGLENLVESTLRALAAATTRDIAEYTEVDLVSISPRIAPMLKKGIIRDSGRTKVGLSGRKSIVWELV
jgi:hypothetical protein